ALRCVSKHEAVAERGRPRPSRRAPVAIERVASPRYARSSGRGRRECCARGRARSPNRIPLRRTAIATATTDRSATAGRPVYIVDGSRPPFLRARGRPGPFSPVDLAVACGRPLLLRQPFPPDAFDEVILGCVSVIADEMNPARIAALRLGMGEAM